MKMFEVKLNNSCNFKECILILPTICVGNVAQLAVDLMISTLETQKIGYIYTSYLHPLIGTEAVSGGTDTTRGNLSTACEIFKSDKYPVIIIQQRSPIMKGYSTEFCTRLKDWIKECGFLTTIILTASFAHFRNDAELAQKSVCKFLTSSNKDRQVLESKLNWRYMELDENEMKPLIPGSGIAHSLLTKCSSEDISAIMCIIFCLEGNNCPEAAILASYVYEGILFQFDTANSKRTINWIPPKSWKYLFGNEVSRTMF